MKIVDVLGVPVRGGFFTDDQAAVRAGARRDGFAYRGTPVTPGFTAVRQPGEALSVLLVLDDGFVAVGDCAAVQYSAVGGRNGVFTAADGLAALEAHVLPALAGRTLSTFTAMSAEVDGLSGDAAGEAPHTAVRYGVTQALLSAVAHGRGLTMAEVVRDEYRTAVPLAPVPVLVQCGDERYLNVDKMILKEVDALPHGLINNVAETVGAGGELFAEYVAWVRGRVLELRAREDYRPTLHFDTYGTVGQVFGGDIARTADYLARLAEVAAPFPLHVEQPMDFGSRSAQVHGMAALRAALRDRGSGVRLVVDEWCNTLADIELFVAAGAADVIHVKTPDLGGLHHTAEALLHVSRHGLAAYCGGTCNETGRSAEACANVAMACGADLLLAKPGMGVDGGLATVGNEMARVAALARARGL